jgi:hypothetical protein
LHEQDTTLHSAQRTHDTTLLFPKPLLQEHALFLNDFVTAGSNYLTEVINSVEVSNVVGKQQSLLSSERVLALEEIVKSINGAPYTNTRTSLSGEVQDST